MDHSYKNIPISDKDMQKLQETLLDYSRMKNHVMDKRELSMSRTYGYVRIWPYEQDTENQIITMREMHVPEKDIFIDRESGSSYMEYQKLLKRLKADDLLYIKSLDALGENYMEIGQQWRLLTKEKKADVVVLDMPQLDTRRGRTQFDTLVADLVQSMLEYAPKAERKTRRQRQKEGIEEAKRRGVQFGRPELPLPDNFGKIYQLWEKKEISGEKAGQLCGMSRSMFYSRAHKWKNMQEHS